MSRSGIRGVYERGLVDEDNVGPEVPLLYSTSNDNSRTRKRRECPKLTVDTLRKMMMGGLICALMVFLVVFTLFVGVWAWRNTQSGVGLVISSNQAHYGWQQCQIIRKSFKIRQAYLKYPQSSLENRNKNSRALPSKPLMIRDVSIWDGNQSPYKADVLIENGIIKKIGTFLHIPYNAEIIEGHDKILTPGLIDMESRLGMQTSTNKKVIEELSPQIRSLDGFDASDPAIPMVVSGGVTTALIFPEEKGLVGGEGFVFKLNIPANHSSEASVLQSGVNEDVDITWRYMNLGCEFNNEALTSANKMKSSFLLKEAFGKATQLMEQQDLWCSELNGHRDGDFPFSGTKHPIKPFPQDFHLEGLVEILRGKAQVHAHCDFEGDLEMLVRLSEEFGFQIWAIHNGLQAYRVPDLIHRAGRDGFNVTVATVADGLDFNQSAPSILVKNNISVAFKSDHPKTNSQFLMREALKAFHNGLDPQLAIASLTSIPAKALGLSHRIGSILVGMDADLALWSNSPLTIGARPCEVIIDGQPQLGYKENGILTRNDTRYTVPEKFPVMHPSLPTTCPSSNTFILTGLRSIVLSKDSHHVSEEGDLVLVLKEGALVCAGSECASAMDSLSSAPQIHLGGDGYVLPGLVGVVDNLGLNKLSNHYESKTILARDGMNFLDPHLKRAFRSGITTSISSFSDNSLLFNGFSVAFSTNSPNALGNSITKDITAFHVSLPTSNADKVAHLRDLLLDSFDHPHMSQVVTGVIPLVVNTHNADTILQLIRLRNELKATTFTNQSIPFNLNLIIIGGGEAWSIASTLSSESIPIILTECPLISNLNCLPGPPHSQSTNLNILLKHNVNLGLSTNSLSNNLLWSASEAYNYPPNSISIPSILGLISFNINHMFNLPVSNDFLISLGNPLNVTSILSHIYTQSQSLTCLN